MTILWPIDPVSGHPLSIETASTAVWVKAGQPPKLSDAQLRAILRADNPPSAMLHAAIDQFLAQRREKEEFIAMQHKDTEVV